jgi:hypothetical protein
MAHSLADRLVVLNCMPSHLQAALPKQEILSAITLSSTQELRSTGMTTRDMENIYGKPLARSRVNLKLDVWQNANALWRTYEGNWAPETSFGIRYVMKRITIQIQCPGIRFFEALR